LIFYVKTDRCWLV